MAVMEAILDFIQNDGFLILVIFGLQATQRLPTKFPVNWPFGSGEEAKNRF